MLDIDSDLASQVAEITREAGIRIMKIYVTDFPIDTKYDQSPVTQADKIAEDFILQSIPEKISADFPIVSEEASSNGYIPTVTDTPFWLVDPLDGTKEFINRNDEFTVNIALIIKDEPVLGVVHLPAQKTTYIGFASGAYRMYDGSAPENISCRIPPPEGLTALVSRSHKTSEVDEYLSYFNIIEKIDAGSSLKFCRIAEGAADIYPRLSRTMEWDTAAGHAVLNFAGGEVRLLNGTKLKYGKLGFHNPDFVALSTGIL